MRKFIFVNLICIFYLSTAVSCTSQKQQIIRSAPPVKSFVKIIKQIDIAKCKKDTKCVPGRYFSTGSGIIVGHTQKNTLILTAAHVCQILVDDSVKQNVKEMQTRLAVIDYRGKFIESVVILASNPALEKKDICLIATSKKIPAQAVKIGKKPRVGDRTYNISAPAGVTHLPAVPILSGIYSGRAGGVNSDLHTIPAIGGSSGSGIFNENYELIGIVVASVRQFHHITLSVKYEDLVKFLEEGKLIVSHLNSK